jgi:hypothetical protein
MFELPPHHIAPLIYSKRKVPMTPNPLSKDGIHNCLTGGADGNGLL